jgi:hypothetical protein
MEKQFLINKTKKMRENDLINNSPNERKYEA